MVIGDESDLKYPPAPAAGSPRDEVCVGDLVRDRNRAGYMWVVREIDMSAKKPTAHLLRVVSGSETLTGDGERFFAVPECITTQVRHLSIKASGRVDQLYTGTSYTSLTNVRGCPACRLGTIVYPPEEVALDLPANLANPLIQVRALSADLYPPIASTSVAQVWVRDQWVFLYDYVYFAVGPDGEPVVHDPEADTHDDAAAEQPGLYAIAQVVGLVERQENDKDAAAEDTDAEVQVFHSPDMVDFEVEFLGRWDSLNHSNLHPAARHPRRLFLTEKRAVIPATAVVGTLCIVPLSHVNDAYFDFPHNFVTVGEHKEHDPLAALRVDPHAQRPVNPADDPATDPLGLQAFTELAINNYSVSVLIHLGRQLKSYAFKAGKPISPPATALAHGRSKTSP
ncbi:hypothetical protein BCR44DRAFT_1146990 [Catenaria anguillulae PL171]|uniref:BAH domain-containing protein n=1 Tax=Catenaria anguillulae PL171 TaxID=765915 RepID=A0A1Y2HIV8_9FUNG|nr:hypothetical protein BCR44DRAFT_1146990 [Catenaria anguillulae PL171]